VFSRSAAAVVIVSIVHSCRTAALLSSFGHQRHCPGAVPQTRGDTTRFLRSQQAMASAAKFTCAVRNRSKPNLKRFQHWVVRVSCLRQTPRAMGLLQTSQLSADVVARCPAASGSRYDNRCRPSHEFEL